MIIPIILVVIGLVLLIKGSNYVVESAVRISKALGISEFVIGMTIVALGTSLPELASSLMGAFANDSAFVLGDIIGSNIANLTLVLGGALLFGTIAVRKHVLKSSFVMAIVSIIFLLFCIDGVVFWYEGLIMLLFLIFYLFYLNKPEELQEKTKVTSYLNHFYHLRGFVIFENYKVFFKKLFSFSTYMSVFKRFFKFKTTTGKIEYIKKEIKEDPFIDIIVLLIGIGIIYLGAKATVLGAIDLANLFGITTNFISLTIVALGTSLPELAVSLTAMRKGLGDILLGNLIGSNISNILLVGGLSALVIPLKVLSTTLLFTLPFMLGVAFFLVLLLKVFKNLKLFHGIILLMFYVSFLGLIVYIVL
jgi:cation:H+ antiporter